MDRIARIISEFRAEQTSDLEDIDRSRKPDIVSSLEDFADDARVIDFFLSVASDESEYDLGRIEVFKILEVKDYASPDTRRRIAQVIRDVLANSGDHDVRNYAAMAAGSYMDFEGVFSEIDRILRESLESSDLRWNAFAGMKAAGPSPRSLDSLRTLLRDDEFQKSASRVLSEWNAN